MIDIINISNYDNYIKKYKITFWQWYKSRSMMWSGYMMCCLLVFWLFKDLLLKGGLYGNILLFMLIGALALAIYELIAPFISYNKSKKKIEERYGLSKSYEITYTLNHNSISYPELDDSKKMYVNAKYSSFRSIKYNSKNNAILFRKSLRPETIVVLLDGLNDIERKQVLTLIPSLKVK